MRRDLREAGGKDLSLYKVSHNNFSIPIKNDFESLNVTVAAGMILYEAMKQRMI